jgi:beta-lactam-binding protein with PASTA domain
MRAFFRFVLLALVLVIVAMGSALTAMRIAIHGREVVVPKVVGLTSSQAERLALQNGLLIDIENRFYSTDIPEGKILSQSPDAGTRVRRGWRIRLAVSLGPQHVVIPDLVGNSSRSAEINLRRRGLEPGETAYAQLPDQPQDQVIAQSPPAAAEGVASPKVNMLFASPAPTPAYIMPSFVGRPLSDAVKALQGAGLKVGLVRAGPIDPEQTTSVTPGVILRQSVAPGQKVLAGTAIDFEVNK